MSRSPYWRAMCVLALCGLATVACGGDTLAPVTALPAVDLSAATIVVDADTQVPDTAVPTEVEATPEPPTSTPELEPTVAPTTEVLMTAVPDKFILLDPGQDRDCDEFASQAEAQEYWDYHRDDRWPNPGRLDGNGNGVVCEAGGGDSPAPAETTAPPAAVRPCDLSLNCGDFGSWSEMFAWWEACGRPEQYDRNGDGVPCEGLR